MGWTLTLLPRAMPRGGRRQVHGSDSPGRERSVVGSGSTREGMRAIRTNFPKDTALRQGMKETGRTRVSRPKRRGWGGCFRKGTTRHICVGLVQPEQKYKAVSREKSAWRATEPPDHAGLPNASGVTVLSTPDDPRNYTK